MLRSCRGKVDDANLTGVVVEEVRRASEAGKGAALYRVATRAGVLSDLYLPAYLQPLPSMTATAMNLDAPLLSWRGMPTVSVRKATRSQSAVGGQGMLRCNCKGTCEHGKCACKRAGRLCTSRCHKNNVKCTNK